MQSTSPKVSAPFILGNGKLAKCVIWKVLNKIFVDKELYRKEMFVINNKEKRKRGNGLKQKTKKVLNELKIMNLFMLTLAGLVNAFGITVFLAPVNLYDSGISGTSMLLDQITPQYLSLSVFLLVLNVPLFIYGLRKQGMAFTIYATYTVAMYSLFAWLITDVLPIDVATMSPLAGEDLVLCSLEND